MKILDVTAFSKKLGTRFFEVEKYGRESFKIKVQSNHANSNHTDLITEKLTNIKLKNQHDLYNYCSLQKMMSWESHDTQASTISVTEQAIKFSTRTIMAYKNVSLEHTHYTVPVQRYKQKLTYRTSNPLSPSNDQSSTVRVTHTGNSTPCNNPQKPVPYVPIDPDSDQISSNSSLLNSSDSL